jgi:hypothetical protein
MPEKIIQSLPVDYTDFCEPQAIHDFLAWAFYN